MTPQTLYFATSGNMLSPASRWLGPIMAAWPSTTPPSTRILLIDELLETLEREGSHTGPDAIPGVVLAAIASGEPPSRIDRLLEGLAQHHAPALILVDKPGDWQMFQRHGVIFRGHDAQPLTAAAMLFALLERQPAVRLLSQEVDLAMRCQGGIRTEIDRLHEELHLAAAIQRDFTSSPLPRLPGIDIDVLFRPVNFVSGDVYSVRDLGQGRAAFFVADAVGHGVPAALLTMVLTSSLLASAGAGTPAQVLARLNQRLCASCLGTGRFATAVYGVVDAPSRRITVAGAGHPLPIVLSRGGSSEIETCGPLLGVFDDAEFDQQEIELGSDETLMLYTDGLDAAFPHEASGSRGALLKRDRWVSDLARSLETDGTGRLPRLLTELQHRLDMQAGSLHAGDDVTAVCITARAA